MSNYNWDLSLIYKDDKQIQDDINKVRTLMEEYNEVKNGEDIKHLLNIIEKTMIIVSRLVAYSNMKRDEDTTVSKNQKLVLEVEDLSSKVDEKFSSFNPLILSLDEKKLNEFLNSTDKSDYKQVIERILRNKEHILSQNEEYLISIAQDIASDSENSFYMLSYADMSFPIIESDKEKRQLTHANFSLMQIDKDRKVRKESFDKMYDTYAKYINTFASDYYGHVKGKEKLAKVRKYNGNIHEELFQDNVGLEVYDTLIEAVHDYIPKLSVYIDIKKKELGLDEITNYDIYVPITEENNKKYTFEDSKKIILDALLPLGEEYQGLLKKGFDERWIDVYPKNGKKSGAYSFGSYDTNPYILLNHTDDMFSLFTIAHEIGHSIHSYYSRKNNPYFQSNYTIFVAEVASTTNELLLLDYMIKNANNNEEKKNLTVYNIEQFRTTVFRQTLFAEFEKIVHEKIAEGEVMTAESLNEIYYNLNKVYYPTLKLDDKISLEWARIPHFYSDFYVYKYATGFSCATFLSQSILKDAKNITKYINFLKDGNKHYPIEQLQIAGVDITKKETIHKALDVFSNKIDSLK